MAREKIEMEMITDYKEETRVQETCGVEGMKSGNYTIGQIRKESSRL